MSARRALRAALLLACALLAGCGGWHLRGTTAESSFDYDVYVSYSDAYTVGSAVVRELVNRGARLTRDRAEADFVVDIDNERYDRRILSIDPNTGKVREIELGLAAEFSVRTGDGKLVVPRETGTWEVDYIFDESSLLGTTEQDSIVQRDLAEVAATTLVFRLQQADPRAGG